MIEKRNDYYVYVYIDPRNYEEFYYGKGRAGRKMAQLKDKRDSEKVSRIKAIRRVGLEPIIRVIAASLSNEEALLIEATLIWKQGRSLTNKIEGYYSDRFRPHNTYHQDIYGFDYKNGVYLVNVGEGPHRCWADCRRFGFLSAGQDKYWGDQMKSLQEGDIVVAYLKGKGYVGIGEVIEPAVMVSKFKVKGKRLLDHDLQRPRMKEHSDDPDKSEYPVRVKWIKTVDADDGKWLKGKGFFTTRLAKASLQNQKKTLEFLEHTLGINPYELLEKRRKKTLPV